MSKDANADAPTGFSADWLRQREPFDLAARSAGLAEGFRDALAARKSSPQRPSPGPSPLNIIDLACGSGANFRALAPVLASDQAWLMVDHDPLLLATLRTETIHWASWHGWRHRDQDGALVIETGTARWLIRVQQHDLASDLEALDLTPCDGIVTTAFLDLVSAAWLDRLSALLAGIRRPLLATLTVDGRRNWLPCDPADRLVTEAFLAHQGGDKGFGPSMGTQAAPYLAALLAGQGYRVMTQASDWQIAANQREMLTALSQEAAAVAAQIVPAHAAAVSRWLADRLARVQQGALAMEVGHLDLLAVPEISP